MSLFFFPLKLFLTSPTGQLNSIVGSDGHDKLFCNEVITIIDNFKKALGDADIIDKSQFLKAISVIDQLYRR